MITVNFSTSTRVNVWLECSLADTDKLLTFRVRVQDRVMVRTRVGVGVRARLVEPY